MRSTAKFGLQLLLVALLAVGVSGCWGKKKTKKYLAQKDLDPTLTVCPPVDIVFIMDTSGSMDDDADALCASIGAVEQNLRDLGLQVIRTQIYGIVNAPGIEEPQAADSAPESGYECLTDTVYRVVGGSDKNHPQVPGNPPEAVFIEEEDLFVNPTILDPTNEESEEYWGPATALIAAFYNWLAGGSEELPPLRIIIPISDESPQTGQDVCYEVDDLAIQNAITVAQQFGVIVSPILGTSDDRDPCIRSLMIQIAEGTGGTFTDLNESEEINIADSIFQIVSQACQQLPAPNGGTNGTPVE